MSAAPAAILISIQTAHANSILSGRKTVELRRRAPRTMEPIPLLIYSSRDARALVGTAMLKSISSATPMELWRRTSQQTAVTSDVFWAYFEDAKIGHALLLSDVRAASSPVPLDLLRKLAGPPPQSWRYINARTHKALSVEMNRPQQSNRWLCS